ncbi:MAG: type II toxin-antitoxin system MqsA family antitoxin [Anaerolineae bacterium]|nr:type II toxin-antitoxin system MqsA family antitoxin [Anaerolineae bacterium]
MSTEDMIQAMCPNCHLGKLKHRKMTFASTFQGDLLVVPNTTALICDVCGETVVDPDMLTRLSGLLSTGKPARSATSPRRPHT